MYIESTIGTTSKGTSSMVSEVSLGILGLR
jgi:hypothetical protein